MSATNTASTYGSVTKVFHWLTALLILTLIPLGLIAQELPFDSTLKVPLFSAHKTLGIIVFAVALARILWTITQTAPGDLHPERRAETLVAHVVHWALYTALVFVPLTGWLHHAATSGFAPIWLPIGQSLPFIPQDEHLAEIFSGLHWIWSKILIVSILLHVAGALKHQIIDKDATLSRMWFGKRPLPETGTRDHSFAAPLIALGIYAFAAAGASASGMLSHSDNTPAPALEQAASDWMVTEGTIGITITQLGNPVTGQFEDWTSVISFDPNATGTMGQAAVTIAIGSLQLGSVSGQAMGGDFFDTANFPTAQFTADITAQDAGYVADGTLTIKDISVPVSMPFTLDITDNTAVMSGGLKLDRRDFQIGQSMADDKNLGFDVSVDINLTATR
ncbi:cytochrome b/b6 domain-containing protein [Loktanella sp. S4079]|uniref:cytochrome b/b6 domain-containing protein n=1 Tax=Loktanella sp. S4079 TaxID=579483 RepID=UPI0005FA2080|nr:cytochrome b/b6 domain-containing protein [Loktanella sp. S4079]KJZ20340.1 cytochrome [Loktanella sp. S4079]